MKSILKQLGAVPFAPHTCERIYMREFRKADGLPFDLARWQPTVDAMLAEVDTAGPIYLMVDQALVRAGQPHRRPGAHIDGYWNPGIQAHGAHASKSAHGPYWGPVDKTKQWGNSDYAEHEGIILASSVAACRAYQGEIAGMPGDGGDCTHLSLAHLPATILQPGVAYAGNVTMIHESLPVLADCLRTVVRLNVPGWSPDVGGADAA